MSVRSDSTNEENSSTRRIWLRRLLKAIVTFAVIWFVVLRGRELLRGSDLTDVRFAPGWLIAAGLAYLTGWLPSLWFWWRLLRTVGTPVPFPQVARGYFLGHLGKYVPGKATVLLIRGETVQAAGGTFGTGMFTAACETLFLIGIGLVWAGVTSVFFIRDGGGPDWLTPFVTHRWLLPVVSVALLILIIPVLSKLLGLVARKMTPGESDSGQSIEVPTRLLITGSLLMPCSWLAMGLSLWCVLRSVGPVDLTNDPWAPVGWSGCVALATTVGFLAVLVPGGLGVREGLLIETLADHPVLTGPQVVVAVVLLRVVWFFAELVAAGTLLLTVRKVPPPVRSNDQPPNNPPPGVNPNPE